MEACTKVLVHLFWGVEEDSVRINSTIKQDLFSHIIQKSIQYGIRTEVLTVQPDHVHLLIQLPANITISSLVRDLKGAAAQWLNRSCNLAGRFQWQKGYAAFSISPSVKPNVIRYLHKQEEHHHVFSFDDELDLWKERYSENERKKIINGELVASP